MSDTTKEESATAELPVFDFGNRKMYPPYILNACQEYEQQISRGDPEVLPEVQRFTIMQAFFAGFSRACAFVDTLYSDPQPEVQAQRQVVLDAIKRELREFSKANRELGAASGLGHVTVKNG